MSSEVVRKRGRPKKVVSESVSTESSEPVKKTTIRQKSTKALTPSLAATSIKPAKQFTTTTTSTPVLANVAPERISQKPQPPTIAIKQPSSTLSTSPKAKSEAQTPPKQSGNTASPPKATSANSKILDQVRGLSSKTGSASQPFLDASKPTISTPPSASTKTKLTTGTNSASRSVPTAKTPTKPTSSSKASSTPPPTSSNSTSTKPPQPVQKTIPIAALNSTIVSQISSRAGARPGSRPPIELPVNYKPVARKVTMVIVAMPIAIVTSWVLYQRLVLGEERKYLVRPGMTSVDETPLKEDERWDSVHKGL